MEGFLFVTLGLRQMPSRGRFSIYQNSQPDFVTYEQAVVVPLYISYSRHIYSNIGQTTWYSASPILPQHDTLHYIAPLRLVVTESTLTLTLTLPLSPRLLTLRSISHRLAGSALSEPLLDQMLWHSNLGRNPPLRPEIKSNIVK